MARNFKSGTLAIPRAQIKQSSSSNMFNLFAQALEKGKNGKKEFQLFYSMLHPQHTQPRNILLQELKKRKGTKNSSKAARLMTSMMLPTPTPLFPSEKIVTLDCNLLSPYYMDYYIDTNSFFMLSTFQPIAFNNNHVSERFKERTGFKFRYKNPSVSAVFPFNLAFIYSVSDTLKSKKIEMAPIVLPHKDGLFLGHIEHSDKFFHCKNFEYARWKDGIFDKGHTFPDNGWSSEYRTYINTFVSRDLLCPEQTKLLEEFSAIATNRDTFREIAEISNIYVTTKNKDMLLGPEEYQASQRLSALFNSPLWAKAIRAASKHLPDRTYKDIIFSQWDLLTNG